MAIRQPKWNVLFCSAQEIQTSSNLKSLPPTVVAHDLNKLSGKKSFIHGKSVKNQRIESYWGQMRQHTVDFCIQMFKCLQEQNLFDGSAYIWNVYTFVLVY
ncbi:Protein of unknown function [Cotesia congregata]|uniref:Integrase core domain-containing protein n=1 Tax=Cotesia congregata TaxID=51543 RepID=A0A8J2HD61_COTCN|nr:Protein of unknown function [Cotesia congregata]